MSRELQTLNQQNKLDPWAEQISYKWQKKRFEMTEAQQQASFAEVTSLVHPSTKIAVTVRIAEADIHGGADAETVGMVPPHAEKTTLQVLHEPGKEPQSKSYMWLYRTSGDTDRPIVMYEYQPGRGAANPKEFLEGFHGYLHTDGYAGYHNFPENIAVVGCWAHLRRKFDEAMKSLPKGKAKNSSTAQGLAYCTLLFEIEKNLEAKPPEQRYKQRLEQAKPVLDAFLAWANVRNAAPKSALGKALTYLKEQWPYLTNYLKHGRLELSNNRAERSRKPFVIDRKNFLFSNTPGGAKGSAVIFTMIQTATENHLDPYRYLTWLLKEANTADPTDPNVIPSLLPWNAPAECRTK